MDITMTVTPRTNATQKMIYLKTVFWSHYNMINFLQITTNKHHVAHPKF